MASWSGSRVTLNFGKCLEDNAHDTLNLECIHWLCSQILAFNTSSALQHFAGWICTLLLSRFFSIYYIKQELCLTAWNRPKITKEACREAVLGWEDWQITKTQVLPLFVSGFHSQGPFKVKDACWSSKPAGLYSRKEAGRTQKNKRAHSPYLSLSSNFI